MLERYFKKGAMFNWTRPSALTVPVDGQIVDKRVPTSPMVFIGTTRDMGLSRLADPTLTDQYLQQVGLAPGRPINYRWLDWAPGRTARVPINTRNILTGPMSGCPIVRWQQGGVNYVGHVGTVFEVQGGNDLVKQTFRAAMPANATGFDPAGAWSKAELFALIDHVARISSPEILAFVTSRGQFYATVFCMVAGLHNRRYCAGTKLVPPLTGPALATLLG